VPAELRKLFESYEAGEPMVQVRIGSWRELEAAARPIRAEVFVAEQRIPAEMEWDDADPAAVHAVALNRLGSARHRPDARARPGRRQDRPHDSGGAPLRRQPPSSMRCSTRAARIARRCCTRSSARALLRARRIRAQGPSSTRRGSPIEMLRMPDVALKLGRELERLDMALAFDQRRPGFGGRGDRR
jgi:hypothetical protein